MIKQGYPKLIAVLESISKKILSSRGRNIGEQNTKATLIDPVLEALGWNIRDWDEVHREFKAKPKDNPVDYALKLLRKPRLLIEAKGLGENLCDRKWIIQILGYATANGVEWCLLTDGDEYRLYKASAPVDAEEKLFRSVKLAEGDIDAAVSLLTPISRENLEENILDVLWDSCFVDRRVKVAIQALLDSKDKGLIRLICKRASKLSQKEVAESLTRLDLRLDSSGVVEISKMPKVVRKKPVCRRGRKRDENLSILIQAGLLKTPLTLFKKYGGRLFKATLLSDGRVQLLGNKYDSLSMAADEARKKITGKKMSTNGWEFWRFSDDSGREIKLSEVRSKYLQGKR